MCDLISWPWPHRLLSLPLRVRLALCVVMFILSQIVYLSLFPLTYNWSVLVLPMGLASWLFLKRGACICYFPTLLLEYLYITLHVNGMSWSPASVLSFGSSVVILFVEGSAFVSLHKLLFHFEVARSKAEESARLSIQAYQQQQHLNLLKHRFIVHVNHELRTPLTVMYSYIEMLQMLFSQQEHTDPVIRDSLEGTLQSCKQLTSLVNNVLYTMEIEHQQATPDLEAVSLQPLLEELLGQLFTLFPGRPHPVTLDIPEQCTVLANREYLRNVFHNLFVNAFTYTPPGTAISVVTTCPPAHPHSITLCLADTGPGIHPKELPLLFQQFVRLDRDLAGTTRGTGLGLYVCKLLVEAMGGRIWAESLGIPGKGSRFYLSLPDSSGAAEKLSLVR
jgi:signal transduction histidine kinase